MVILLKCQEDCVLKEFSAEKLNLFAIALICSLLDTFEVDLTADELTEISQFSKEWSKK